MSKKRIRTVVKELAILLGIVVIAFGIELFVFNYHSFVKGECIEILYKDDAELPEGVKSIKKLEESVKLNLKKATYIKKLQVQFDVAEKTSYIVNVRYNNLFDAEETEELKDVYWPELGTGYTNIGRSVKAIRVKIPEGMSDNIKSIRLYTETDVNPYRVLFFVVVSFLVVMFLHKWTWLEKRPEWILVVIGLTIGCYFIYMNGIQENGWDEQIHFNTAYQLSFSGEMIETNNTIQMMQERIPQNAYNTYEEKELYTQYLNNNFSAGVETVERTIRWSYKQTGYVIQVFAVWLGQILNLSFNNLYMFGRFFNLCTYLFLMFLSIKLVPKRKNMILALALIPTQIYIASTYTYDAVINGFLMLGFVFWLKIIWEENTEKTIVYLLGSIFSFLIGSLSKAIYIPLVLLCCCVPKNKFHSLKQYYVFWGVIISGCILVILSFAFPVIKLTATNQVGMMGDSRGGNTDVVLQLRSILKQPLGYVSMLGKEIIQSAGKFLLGNEGLANFGRMRELPEDFMCIMVPWFLVASFVKKDENNINISFGSKMVLLAAILTIIIFIWSAMYLVYTPIGLNQINGVQARYYFPLLAPLIIVLDKINISMKNLENGLYLKIISGVPCFILFVALYNLFLKPQCF